MRSLLDLVLIDLYDCDHEKLLEAVKIKEAMLSAAKLMGAEVVGHSFHTFKHRMDHKKAYKYLTEYFGCRNPMITHQKRGFIDSEVEELHLKQEATQGIP
jgi:S-adenosylmethionine decarboxylase